jgi:peptide chain release factor 1
MTPALERRLEAISARHDALVAALVADPPPPSAEIARINKELARAERVVRAYAAVKERRDETASLEQVIAESTGVDAEMAQMAKDELATLEETTPALEETLAHLLLPADEADDSGVILEVRAGAGGDEAALFAADLLRMYEMFARKTGWRFELVAAAPSETGGVKEATASLAGEDVYGRLKFESGVHRVQRVPATETQGRVHTSTASVAVLPQAETVELHIRDEDLKIDTMRASGAGGQHVNTTNSAVRITHAPTGVTVVMQDERSQHKNKEKAMKVLRARVYELERRKLADARADRRRSLIGSGDRSERVRTYNYKEGRVKDHRVNVLLNDLPGLLDGGDALGEMLDALKLEERRQLMAEFSVSSE